MTKRFEIYKCQICGNIVEVLDEGAGELVCCGQPMLLLQEKTEESEIAEKHIPVFSKTKNGFEVKVGEVPHPMSEEHHIVFVEAFGQNERCIKYLSVNQEPKVEFLQGDILFVREYCNIHGLWSNRK